MKHQEQEVIKAYVWIRENNQTIPDDILDLMKNAAIEKINSSNQSTISILEKIKGEIEMEIKSKEEERETAKHDRWTLGVCSGLEIANFSINKTIEELKPVNWDSLNDFENKQFQPPI